MEIRKLCVSLTTKFLKDTNVAFACKDKTAKIFVILKKYFRLKSQKGIFTKDIFSEKNGLNYFFISQKLQ